MSDKWPNNSVYNNIPRPKDSIPPLDKIVEPLPSHPRQSTCPRRILEYLIEVDFLWVYMIIYSSL